MYLVREERCKMDMKMNIRRLLDQKPWFVIFVEESMVQDHWEYIFRNAKKCL